MDFFTGPTAFGPQGSEFLLHGDGTTETRAGEKARFASFVNEQFTLLTLSIFNLVMTWAFPSIVKSEESISASRCRHQQTGIIIDLGIFRLARPARQGLIWSRLHFS